LKWSHFFRLPHRNLYVVFCLSHMCQFLKIKHKQINTPSSLKLRTYLVCTCVLHFLPSILLCINRIDNIADISKISLYSCLHS
jgi:hypothetical protein